MLADRFLGSLVGLAVGDILGGPAEGLDAKEIETLYGRIEGPVECSPERPTSWRQRGLHSDDTQQALVIAEAILEAGRADPDIIVEKLVELSEGPRTVPFGAHRGTGRNFRFSVMLMRQGDRWSSGARNTAGIGASMRVAPVGLFYAGDDPALRDNACLSALVTHTDPRGCLAACAVAYLVARVSRARGELDAAELHAAVLDFTRRSEGWFEDVHGSRSHPEVRQRGAEFGDALEALAGSWRHGPATVLPAIEEKASALARYEIGHPCRGFALAGVIAAIYFFLRHRHDVPHALMEAVNAGGDTDSVGAIVGALCGAAAGIDAIPHDWTESLCALEQIRLRAQALAGEAVDEEAWRPLADFELDLTLEEDRQRRAAFPDGTFPDTYEWETPPPRRRPLTEDGERRREASQSPRRRPRGGRRRRSSRRSPD